jgi:flagellar motility protein MotE (MotC chaperone)
MSEVPGIGALFPEPEEEDPAAKEEKVSPKPRRSENEIIQSGLGSLGVWSLPAPYTSEELRSLVDELKAKLLVADRREVDLSRREEDLELELETLSERYLGLEQMRAELEQYESELDLREDEVSSKEGLENERNLAKWRSVAPVLAMLEPEEAAKKIVRYPAKDAAEILHAMTDIKAGAILTSIPDENFREYLDAYSEKSSLRQ